MSIEQALAENTAALKQLIVLLSKAAESAAESAPAPKAGKKKADAVAAPAAEAAPAPAATPAPSASNPAPAAASASPELMKEIAAEVTKLANAKGRDSVVGALAKFSATKIPEIVAAGNAQKFLEHVKALNNADAGASDFM